MRVLSHGCEEDSIWSTLEVRARPTARHDHNAVPHRLDFNEFPNFSIGLGAMTAICHCFSCPSVFSTSVVVSFGGQINVRSLALGATEGRVTIPLNNLRQMLNHHKIPSPGPVTTLSRNTGEPVYRHHNKKQVIGEVKCCYYHPYQQPGHCQSLREPKL
jgi:hypothetical protein